MIKVFFSQVLGFLVVSGSQYFFFGFDVDVWEHRSTEIYCTIDSRAIVGCNDQRWHLRLVSGALPLWYACV